MPRMISIFSNIKDLEKVLELYDKEIFPILFSYPGVSRCELHRIEKYLSPDLPGELANLQIIFETHFETFETLSTLINSPKGERIMQLMADNDIGDYYMYWSEVNDIQRKKYNPEEEDEKPNYDELANALETIRKLIESKSSNLRKERLFSAIQDLQTELNLLKVRSDEELI